MIRREHITAPELLFLSLAAAGVIGVVAAGLLLVFRAAGWDGGLLTSALRPAGRPMIRFFTRWSGASS